MNLPLFAPRAGRLVERNILVYRKIWFMFMTGMIEPVLYMLAIGIGLGSLVGSVHTNGRTIAYAAFIAPGLMAASAMNGSIFDSTIYLFIKLRHDKIYETILATPVGPLDIAAGELIWALLRSTAYAASFIILMAWLGLLQSPLAILMLPSAALIGFCFAAVGMAATTLMRNWQDLDFVPLVTVPMFLFSATFFPLSAYPPFLQAIVQITPLYHAVNLLRGLSLGSITLVEAADAVYLLGLGIFGAAVVSRRIKVLLLR